MFCLNSHKGNKYISPTFRYWQNKAIILFYPRTVDNLGLTAEGNEDIGILDVTIIIFLI